MSARGTPLARAPARYNRRLFVSAIIAAGGRGRRFGGDVPKQLLLLAGRSLLERSVALFVAHPQVDEIVVALPAHLIAAPPSYLASSRKPVRVVAGGARRQDSVASAFQSIDRRTDVVVIHDAARPFASSDLIARTIDAAVEYGAAVAAVQSSDTVKRARTATGGDLLVEETLVRSTIYLAQTPQAFQRAVLREAIAAGAEGADATDEASLAERAGHAVRIVEGERANIKVTTPEDLAEAAARAGREGEWDPAIEGARIGTGYDLHRLVEGRPLVIGGIVVPSDRGALGHSDADVVCHAITDAILGAASLGDIGRHFPDSDPQWQGASSLDLLRRAAALAADQGLAVVNVDATVVLERPKVADHIGAMRSAVARVLGIEPGRVGIKGKTNEGVDAVGRGEAIAAHAVALLRASVRRARGSAAGPPPPRVA
ncbi:MAG: 2-C-methyl-D-erythritol 4-phosphate cytidylyltransferase [Luteitalea sp.]|nr:2-C-methyl-D-erythritol 4-phosphate cytidylyltransferase [Luteitalea sp.]